MTDCQETASAPPPETPRTDPEGTWRDQLRSAVRDLDELCDRLGLPAAMRAGQGQGAAGRADAGFPIVVPQAFLRRMRHGDPQDPLLLQVLPTAAESAPAPAGFGADPVGEAEALRAPGLLQKYRGRALLIVTGVCAVACRYCFRRHFPYDDAPNGLEHWEDALDVIERSPDLEEIILSGGDPLMRSDAWLAALVERLEAIPHLRRIRVHTRLPIVIPDRVTSELLAWLGGSRLAPTLVVHSNHPAELDAACGDALLRLVKAGIPVLNQTVLLRGINDDADVLTELSRRLLDLRVLPYYLHQLDPVDGAAHFEVPTERGLALVQELSERLPGFGVPRYVREVPGAASKVPFARRD